MSLRVPGGDALGQLPRGEGTEGTRAPHRGPGAWPCPWLQPAVPGGPTQGAQRGPVPHRVSATTLVLVSELTVTSLPMWFCSPAQNVAGLPGGPTEAGTAQKTCPGPRRTALC